MKADTEEVLAVRRVAEARRRQEVSVTMVPPSHCEGSDITGTPTAPWEKLAAFGTGQPAVLSSNDCAEAATVDAALERPSVAGCRLVVGESGGRRSPEHSRKVVLGAGDTGHVVERNAGVAPPSAGPDYLWELIRAICRERGAAGVPEPAIARVGRSHAGTFQLGVVERLVGISGSAMWFEGASWSARHRLDERFRFRVERDSVAEGVKLVEPPRVGGPPETTANGAVSPKTPPGMLRGFCPPTRRIHFSRSEALAEGGGVAEPGTRPAEAWLGSLGSALDGRYRRDAGGRARQWTRLADTEPWEPSTPTKRGPSA